MPDLSDVADILGRYRAVATEDFTARNEPVGELAAVLEQVARSEFENEWAGIAASPDGVALESVSEVGRVVECHGKLWLLNGGSWSLPIHATFSLSEDRNTLTSSEIRIGDRVVVR